MPRRAATVLSAVGVAAVLNYLVAGFAGDVVFNLGRAAIAFFGGWLMVSSAQKGLLMAALTGAVVLVVDHVILKGGFFVVAHYWWPAAVEGKGLLAAGGVLVSFVMFVPLAMLASWAGGFAARRKANMSRRIPNSTPRADARASVVLLQSSPGARAGERGR